MSIESVHAYRFGFLKSEKWSNVRLEALAREGGHCQICREESISNDAHHIWYPENIYETTEAHLVILCRPCHDFLHSMMPECKTRDEQEGRENWLKFSNSIIAWRTRKWTDDFVNLPSEPKVTPSGMRKRLSEMAAEIARLKNGGDPIPPELKPERPPRLEPLHNKKTHIKRAAVSQFLLKMQRYMTLFMQDWPEEQNELTNLETTPLVRPDNGQETAASQTRLEHDASEPARRSPGGNGIGPVGNGSADVANEERLNPEGSR